MGNEVIERGDGGTAAGSPPGGLPAVLLLGPTGAGKTPLGRMCARRGLWGRICTHVDFGACLRRAAAGDPSLSSGLNAEALAVVRRSLETGALIEDAHIAIAVALFTAAVRHHPRNASGLIILNGLPRHAGQARDMRTKVTVAAVVRLDCPAAVVHRRLAANTGGDRTGRKDDDPERVTRKLTTFHHRTLPLIDYYVRRGATRIDLPVSAASTAHDLYADLAAREIPPGLAQQSCACP